MKKYLVLELIKYMISFINRSKKMKRLLIIFSILFVFTFGLFTWGIYSSMAYIAKQSVNIIETSQIQEKIDSTIVRMKTIYNSDLKNCLSSTSDLISFENIVNQNYLTIFQNISRNCFGNEQNIKCESENCTKTKTTTEENYI